MNLFHHEVSNGEAEQKPDLAQHAKMGRPSEGRQVRADEIFKRALLSREQNTEGVEGVSVQHQDGERKSPDIERPKGPGPMIFNTEGERKENTPFHPDDVFRRALLKPKISTEQAPIKNLKSDENETPAMRELTQEEREYYSEKLGWTDKQLDKCTIDENGTIHYRTDRADMEGKTDQNGVRYERKTVDIHGVKIEGVFPVFKSAYNAKLSENLENASNAQQFKECNRQLKDAVDNDPQLKSTFTEEQLQDIEERRTPEGYVWHHNEEPGKMQLVKVSDHDRTQGGAAHTGGKALWGGGY